MDSYQRFGGLQPVVETLDDVNAALHEMAWLKSRADTVIACTNQQIELLKFEAQKKLQLTIEGETISYADRLAVLDQAIKTWCKKRLDRELQDGKQSIDLAHGRVGWKRLPDAVVCTDDRTEKDVVAAIAERVSLKTLIAKWLCAKLGALTLANVLRLKPELDKTAAKKAFENARAKQTLRSLGLDLATDRREWVIEPASLEVAAPAA